MKCLIILEALLGLRGETVIMVQIDLRQCERGLNNFPSLSVTSLCVIPRRGRGSAFLGQKLVWLASLKVYLSGILSANGAHSYNGLILIFLGTGGPAVFISRVLF